jgi:hypothetical protein
LHRHHEHERGLPVARGPERAAHRSNGRRSPRHSRRDAIRGIPTSGLPDVESPCPADTRPPWHRDADPFGAVAGETGCDQGRRSVELGARTGLEDGRPVPGFLSERPCVQGDSLAADPTPTPRPHLRPDLGSGDPQRVRLHPRHDARLSLSHRLERGRCWRPTDDRHVASLGAARHLSHRSAAICGESGHDVIRGGRQNDQNV